MKNTIFALAFMVLSLGVSQAKDASQPIVRETLAVSAVQVLDSPATAKLKTPQAKVKYAFDELVRSYGVENRVLIVDVLSEVFPEEFHPLIAKRAMYYSPTKAKEIADTLSKRGKDASNSVFGSLPSQTMYASAAAGAAPARPARTFRLPDVQERRRVNSVTDPGGRIIQVTGDLGGQTVTATLGPVQDNGFTQDGLGYTVVGPGGVLIGVYLGLEQTGPKTFKLSFKCIKAGLPQGSGTTMIVITCP